MNHLTLLDDYTYRHIYRMVYNGVLNELLKRTSMVVNYLDEDDDDRYCINDDPELYTYGAYVPRYHMALRGFDIDIRQNYYDMNDRLFDIQRIIHANKIPVVEDEHSYDVASIIVKDEPTKRLLKILGTMPQIYHLLDKLADQIVLTSIPVSAMMEHVKHIVEFLDNVRPHQNQFSTGLYINLMNISHVVSIWVVELYRLDQQRNAQVVP